MKKHKEKIMQKIDQSTRSEHTTKKPTLAMGCFSATSGIGKGSSSLELLCRRDRIVPRFCQVVLSAAETNKR
jgi:hypothetical protein